MIVPGMIMVAMIVNAMIMDTLRFDGRPSSVVCTMQSERSSRARRY